MVLFISSTHFLSGIKVNFKSPIGWVQKTSFNIPKEIFMTKFRKKNDQCEGEKKYRITRLTTYTYFFTLKSQDDNNYIS